MRGYFGIGVYSPKKEINIGTLWRTAYSYGAGFIFTIGKRYKKQPSDTCKTWRHTPLLNYVCFDDFKQHIPFDCRVVCVEIASDSVSLPEFEHPDRVIYLLGAEDNGIPTEILSRYKTITIPAIRGISLNVAVAGSIVMYDRHRKGLI